MVSHVQLFVILWTVARQAPLSMRLFRQEYWGGLPLPHPRGSFWPRDQPHVSCISRHILFFFFLILLKPTPWSSEGKHQSQQKPARQKQLSEFARQLRTRFLPLFPLICCYTHSAQDNVKFLKLRFPAYEKSGAGKRGPPGSYFKLGLRDVVGGWRGPRRSLANQ